MAASSPRHAALNCQPNIHSSIPGGRPEAASLLLAEVVRTMTSNEGGRFRSHSIHRQLLWDLQIAGRNRGEPDSRKGAVSCGSSVVAGPSRRTLVGLRLDPQDEAVDAPDTDLRSRR